MKKKSRCGCGGEVEWQLRLVEIQGTNFGHQEVGSCKKCKSNYLKDEIIDMIEKTLG